MPTVWELEKEMRGERLGEREASAVAPRRREAMTEASEVCAEEDSRVRLSPCSVPLSDPSLADWRFYAMGRRIEEEKERAGRGTQHHRLAQPIPSHGGEAQCVLAGLSFAGQIWAGS